MVPDPNSTESRIKVIEINGLYLRKKSNNNEFRFIFKINIFGHNNLQQDSRLSSKNHAIKNLVNPLLC